LQIDAGERFKRPGIEPDTEPRQTSAGTKAAPCRKFFTMAFTCGLVAANGPAIADGCAFQPQGDGRVAAVLDGRSFALKTAARCFSPASSRSETKKPKIFQRCQPSWPGAR
jgi:hypothetical protein